MDNKKQQQIIDELILTEENYVKDLHDVVQVYEPCFHILNTVTREDVDMVFSNVGDILQLSRSLLAALFSAEKDPMKIAECFLDRSSDFHVYSAYCTSYHRANERLFELKQENSVLSTILLDLQRSLGHALPLSSYLHKPVQRILKYHLILKNMLRSCNDDLSRSKVQEAYDCMARCAEEINNSKRLTEMDVKTRELHELLLAIRETDHFGKLIREGEMTLQDGGSNSKLMFVYLFENVLVLCNKVQGVFALHRILRCAELVIMEDNPKRELEFTVLPFATPSSSVTLKARSLAQKLDWCIQLHKHTAHNMPCKAKKLLLSNNDPTKSESSTPKVYNKKVARRRPSLPLLSPNSLGRRVKRHFRDGVSEILTKSKSSINLRRSSSSTSGNSSMLYAGSADTISLTSDLSASSDGTSRTGGSRSATVIQEQSYDEMSTRANKLHHDLDTGDFSNWHQTLVLRMNQFGRSPKHRAMQKKLLNKSKSCIELTTPQDEISSDEMSDLSMSSSRAESSTAHITPGKKNLFESKSQLLRRIVKWRRKASKQPDKTRSPSIQEDTTQFSLSRINSDDLSQGEVPFRRVMSSTDESQLATVSDDEDEQNYEFDNDDESEVKTENGFAEDENCNVSVFELNISDNFSDSLIECFNTALQPSGAT